MYLLNSVCSFTGSLLVVDNAYFVNGSTALLADLCLAGQLLLFKDAD